MAASLFLKEMFRALNTKSLTLGSIPVKNIKSLTAQKYSSKCHNAEFGLFFDIDGVLVRGRTVLPHTREAFKHLVDDSGKFVVPTIFVTNAGNTLRQKKAAQLSEWLGVEIASDQVVMSHSPLKMFHQFRDKHVLVSGQGPVADIAANLGFTKVTTMEFLRHTFPTLDMVDHKRRRSAPCGFQKYFPKIDAVILFGEPVRWETNLQLLLDVLLTNGHPSTAPTDIPYPHLPVLACNMDLMWMAEAPMPRFGHGCFLHCLESLYQKISGYELKYTALVGKPSEITYHHSEHVLQLQARKMKLPPIKRMYCIGDNPDADIYGANLYNRYLQKKLEKLQRRKVQHGGGETGNQGNGIPDDSLSVEEADHSSLGVQCCESVLVCTGVYSRTYDNETNVILDHNHRDFIMDADLKKPSLSTVNNVLEALKVIYRKEGFSAS